MPPQEFDVVSEVESLIDGWCDRRELGALARVLPAWTSNGGLTDGWADVLGALQTVRSDCRLPDDETRIVDDAIAAVERSVLRAEPPTPD